MTTTAFQGPLISFGMGLDPTDRNPDRAPSLFDLGSAILDPRAAFTYRPGMSDFRAAAGWYNGGPLCLINQAPSALSAVNLAAAQVPVAGTPMTLVSASGGGITVGVSLVRRDTGVAVTVLAIDGAATQIPFGRGPAGVGGGAASLWDPEAMVARNLRFTSVGNDSAATVTIRGFDVYGYPMTETVTLANAAVASGLKAFKYILSITPAGTLSGSTVSVGTGDVIGIPMRSDFFGQLSIVYNNAVVTANTGYTAAVTTTPTATTGDTKGTYALQTASDGTRRLHVYLTPRVSLLDDDSRLSGGVWPVGLLGQQNFFNF